MHTMRTLHLSEAQVSQIEASMSNDENSTNEEMIDFFVQECGIFQYPAEFAVNQYRMLYLNNIFIGNDTPLRNGSSVNTSFKA